MILVTGGSGFVGSHVLRRLRGRPRRALVRDAGRLPPEPGLEPVEGNLTRRESLEPALAGVEVVIHAAALTANLKEPYPGAYEAVNHRGTANLVDAARRAGVRRLVVLSGLGTKPAPEGTYMATRQAMEVVVRDSGIPFVILQPSVLFGGGAAFISALADLARISPVVPVLGGGGLKFQPLWIEDLVTCLLAATEEEGAGGRLAGRSVPLGGSEYATLREIQETIAQVTGRRRLLVPVPVGLVAAQARLMSAVLPRPPITPATLELFSFENATDLDACEKAFGFRPRGFREHLLAHGLEG